MYGFAITSMIWIGSFVLLSILLLLVLAGATGGCCSSPSVPAARAFQVPLRRFLTRHQGKPRVVRGAALLFDHARARSFAMSIIRST
jgi:hypothetical protein